MSNISLDNNCRGSWHGARSCIKTWIWADGCHLVLSFRMSFAVCRHMYVIWSLWDLIKALLTPFIVLGFVPRWDSWWFRWGLDKCLAMDVRSFCCTWHLLGTAFQGADFSQAPPLEWRVSHIVCWERTTVPQSQWDCSVRKAHFLLKITQEEWRKL